MVTRFFKREERRERRKRVRKNDAHERGKKARERGSPALTKKDRNSLQKNNGGQNSSEQVGT